MLDGVAEQGRQSRFWSGDQENLIGKQLFAQPDQKIIEGEHGVCQFLVADNQWIWGWNTRHADAFEAAFLYDSSQAFESEQPRMTQIEHAFFGIVELSQEMHESRNKKSD